MRDTNTDATDASRSIGSPRFARSSSPSRYAFAASSYRSTEKSSVTLMLIPAAIDALIAGTPAAVPGILIITLGRSTACHSRCAAAIVPSVSFASVGDTSSDT